MAVAPGGVEGQAFVGLGNDRVGSINELRLIDLDSGEVLVAHPLAGRVRALTGDESTVYAAVDADPALLLFDAYSGEPLGSIGGDFRLSDVEIAAGDAAHDGLSDVDLPSSMPPPGVVLAASGERSDITVWFGDQRVTHIVPGSEYDEKVAFGVDGVLYAGARRYQEGNFLVVLEPLSGAVLAEIRLDGAPGNIMPTPDGELVFVETLFSSGGGLSIIDATSSEIVHELRPRGDWRGPSMTPDGAHIVARDGAELVVLDTRGGAVRSYPFEMPAVAVAATAAGAHYLGEDGHLYAVDLETGATTVGAPIFDAATRFAAAGQLAGGTEALIAYRDGNCGAELASVDAFSGELRATLSSNGARWLATVAAGGDYAQTGYASSVDLWDLRSGRVVSRLVRPEGFDGGNLIWSIATGCLGDCPPPPLAPERVRWELLPSATPTLTPTPSPTPTPHDNPPVEQSGVWLRVDATAGEPGDIVDIRIRRNWQRDDVPSVTGYQLDVWLPDGVRPRQWREGEPDCRLAGDREDVGYPYRPYRAGQAFLPDGCHPDIDCTGIRVLVTAEREFESLPWLVCTARLDGDLPPGSYPMSVDNLYLASDPPSDRLQAVVGDIYVLDGPRAPTPTPDYDLVEYGPTLAPTPQLMLRGRDVETDAGWVNDIEFKLSGGALAPFRGDLRTVLEMSYPLRPAISDGLGASCQRNPELSNGGTFELLPSGCAATDDCSAVAVWVKVDPGLVGFESGDPPVWFYRPDIWLFRCDVKVDEAAEDGQSYVRLGAASFDQRSVLTRDVLVDTFVPWHSPTATPTGTPTPRPRQTPRPCAARDGEAVVCVDDLEASPGDAVDLTVHYHSGGVLQVGLEFVIDLGDVFVPPGVVIGGPYGEGVGRCRVNPDIDKNGSAFSLHENRIKALILALDNVDPLPDDVRLITCTLDVAADAEPGEHEVPLLEPGGADNMGNELPLATRSGFLRVRGTVIASPTATPRPETPTATREPTPTAQAETRDLEAAGNDSGCHVTEARHHWISTLLLLLWPSLLLRRRGVAVRRPPRPTPPTPRP